MRRRPAAGGPMFHVEHRGAAGRGITLACAAALLFAALLPGVLLAGPAAATAVVPAPAGSGGLLLVLDDVTPRLVTGGGPDAVTLVGTLRNTGDAPIDDLEVRLQRGEALRTDGEVRDALAGTGRTDAATPAFTALRPTLDPGDELPLSLTVPLRGAPQDGLALTRPGVYEVLLNVNGVPRGGLRARLAAQRLLLPVLSLPPGPAGEPAVPAPAGDPADLTVLYPLVDLPRRLPTVPGEPTLLTDDDLAGSFAPSGRLGGLLAAYAGRATPGSAVRTATCLAVDPDLVATAAAMTQGYTVRGGAGTPVPGTGAGTAKAWLDGLVAAARGGCVVALPFADADLGALTRGALGGLARTAVADGRAVLAAALGTPVVPGTTWPGDGALDGPALGDLAAAGTRAVVLPADAVNVAGDGPTGSGVVPLVAAGSPAAVLTDPLITRAASTGPADSAPDRSAAGRTGGIAGPITSTSAGASPPLSTQDALGALVYRTQAPAAGPVVLAPPHRWIADATAAGALLDGVATLLDGGEVRARALPAVVAAGPTGPARRPVDPLQADDGAVPPAVVAAVRDLDADVADLRSAAVAETGVGAAVDATFAPLVQATLRPVSSAWHDRPQLAAGAAAATAERIAALRGSVRVLAPPSPYSLGTRTAPLLVTVANGLPVTVEVRLSLSATTGLRTAPIPAQRIPPLGRRQVQVDAQVVRSGQFVVEATVRTPAGRDLGPPSRLQVRSTAYGTITVWLTGCAGVLLVVLAARRVVRRVRGEPGRRDRVAPATGPADPPATSPPAAGPASASASTPPVPADPEPEPPTRPVPARRP